MSDALGPGHGPAGAYSDEGGARDDARRKLDAERRRDEPGDEVEHELRATPDGDAGRRDVAAYAARSDPSHRDEVHEKER
jgi:hypothetical protein